MRNAKLAALGLATFLAACTPETPAPLSPELSPQQKRSGPASGLSKGDVDFCLTLLHNNDGETQLVGAPGQPLYGGASRFVSLVRKLRSEAESEAGKASDDVNCGLRGLGKRAAIVVSSGDNWLAGPQFNASLSLNTFFDAKVLDAIGYDAIVLGNHEFDFGPGLLADLINATRATAPFLSANLDFSGEPALAALFTNERSEALTRGRIARSVIVRKRSERIGVVGATTPLLAGISSPGNVVPSTMVASAIQREIDEMRALGVDKFIVGSHLQSLTEDLALIPMLRHVDIFIAGGGSDLLINPSKGVSGTRLVPGDLARTTYPTEYPTIVNDADNRPVLLVTTDGNYKYVGRLIAGFDRNGEIVHVGTESGPVVVADVSLPGGVEKDAQVFSEVETPVQTYVNALAVQVIAQSAVPLDARTSVIRTREATVGNLFADALLFEARRRAASFGVPAPQVALQNSGGIRSNAIVAAGPISVLNTFDLAAFSNFVAIVPNIPRDQFKALIEFGIAVAPVSNGRFPQIAGMVVEYRLANPSGSRVVNMTLNDGTEIVKNGAVLPGAPITLSTNDFTAAGGDLYPFNGAPFTRIGITYQQALANYLAESTGLGGVISAAQYPDLSVNPLPGAAAARLISVP